VTDFCLREHGRSAWGAEPEHPATSKYLSGPLQGSNVRTYRKMCYVMRYRYLINQAQSGPGFRAGVRYQNIAVRILKNCFIGTASQGHFYHDNLENLPNVRCINEKPV
jgi:hypothetical protein